MDGYIKLTEAIIKQAIKDYKAALVKSATQPREASTAKSLERFFLSKWGQCLSFDHGELIIERTKKEVAQYAGNEN